jgi:hypothetical protein
MASSLTRYYIIKIEKNYSICSGCDSACILTEDQCKWRSTKWIILLKDSHLKKQSLNDMGLQVTYYNDIQWTDNLLTLLAADPPASHPEWVPPCLLSCFPQLCWVPTDFFPQNRVGLALCLPPSANQLQGALDPGTCAFFCRAQIGVCYSIESNFPPQGYPSPLSRIFFWLECRLLS